MANEVHFNAPSSLEKQSTFQYTPLNSSEIRPLKIQPGCEDDEVRCTIDHFDSPDPPTYVAVSYRWGTGDERIHIQIDGQRFNMMPNAFFALHYLRNHHVDRHLWLDAVCIDQSNIAERNKQVKLMGEIFSQAKEVIVWLGPQDEHTALAFSGLQSSIRDGIRDPNQRKLRQSANALEHLFQREYWSRMWIIQEIFFARQISIVCGGYQVSWDYLEAFITRVVPSWKNRIESLDRISKMSVTTLVENRIAYHNQDQLYTGKNKLWEALNCYSHFNCSDPRDRLYALIYLYSDATTSRFEIDYSRSVDQLLIYFATYFSLVEPEQDLISICKWVGELLDIDTEGEDFKTWIRRRSDLAMEEVEDLLISEAVPRLPEDISLAREYIVMVKLNTYLRKRNPQASSHDLDMCEKLEERLTQLEIDEAIRKAKSSKKQS